MSDISRGIWVFGLLGVLLSVAACSPKSVPPPVEVAARGFVGNAPCEACHAAEFQSHHHSRHMQTLLVAGKTELGALAPSEGAIPGGGKVGWDQEQLLIEFPNKVTEEPVPVPIDLVVGSGKSGMTYLAVHDKGSVELRRSYFPKEKTWHFTPGMEKYDPNVVGVDVSLADTAKCIRCHSVPVPDGPLLPERKFLGVGCESCHGPAGAHVQAMQKGEKSLGLQSLKGVGGAELNRLCGQCHQTIDSVTKDALSTTATSRFQPYGLSQSKCFKASGDKLTCVTCHNPHQDASTDTKGYEKTCLSCHTAPKKACPVNPKEKCVSCHMPEKAILPGTAIPTKMADHFIRIYRQEERAR